MEKNQQKEKIYIFHIFRSDGQSLFLHPLSNPDKLVAQLGNAEVIGRYGKEPRVEALTLFRNELYREIETSVKRWLADIRFIPKFLISAAVFIITYFFLSFVIRDPVPLIDEIAISLGVSVVLYYLLSRRDISSEKATKKRLVLRSAVDKITFRQSPFVQQVEKILHQNESSSIKEVIRQILEPIEQQLSESQKEEADHFIQLLEGKFNFKRIKRKERKFQRYLKGSSDKSQHIHKLGKAKKLDFPLYAVYKSLKKITPNAKSQH